ncbi:MAG: DUF1573 domain-containing protein [Bacteroidota bacterium]
MKCFSILSFVFILFYSCGNKKINTYENSLGVVPGHLAQIDTMNYTVINFADSVKDFGTVKSGEPVILKYRFKNAGKTALFISNVQPACGCTVADYPRNPILPDEEGIITATFNTKNHPGFIHKTITVTSNTSNGIKHVLLLTGQVKDSL